MTPSVARLFSARARATPRATAIVCSGSRVSYETLDAESNRFARCLRRHGAAPETVVALHLEHGLPAFVALLGVVKSGAAYVALTPSDPIPRTCELLADSRAAVLVTDRRELEPRGFAGATIRVPDDLSLVERESADPLAPIDEPGHLFQIVFTSGSTGRPKGVLVPLSAILNRLAAMWASHPFRPDDVALLHRPFSIIGSSWDCFGPLLAGVPTVIVRSFDPGVSTAWRQLRAWRISHLAAAPSMWELLLDQAERRPGEWQTLRLAITGGQPIDVAFVRRWKRAFPEAVLLNVYGATECVYATAFDARGAGDAADRVPAGLPFPNVQVHVLDGRLQAVPHRSVGELCIGGACLARGYANDPALTAERFVPNPHAAAPGAVLFRTGDLGFAAEEGVVHVIGRRDRQVKVRGFRVDLSEVESALLRCERIAAAAVVAAAGERGDNQLIAYVVTTDRAPLSARQVRRLLGWIVPRHMLPSSVVALPAMPLTRSGKVDYQALRAIDAPRAERQPVPSGAPPLATWLARTVQDVLGVAAVGPGDNFFDLGGDSLSAMRIAARIRETLNVDVDASVILDADTVERLAELVSTAGHGLVLSGSVGPS